MSRFEIYCSIPNKIKSDLLTDFINSYIFNLNGFGHQFDDPDASCKDRIIGDFELIYVIDGESFITIGDQNYHCNAGDIILIPPFTKHKILSSRVNPHNNYWIHFDVYPFYKQNDFIGALMFHGKTKMSIGVLDDLMTLYTLLDKEVNESKMGSRIFVNTLLTQIFISIMRTNKASLAYENNEIISNNTEVDIINKSTNIIKNNISSNLKLEDICKEIHISESYLYKAFMKVLKMSPKIFIRLYKVKQAEQLLKSSDLSIKEIAEKVGFSSSNYFSNVFKEFYSMSPREYIKSIK